MAELTDAVFDSALRRLWSELKSRRSSRARQLLREHYGYLAHEVTLAALRSETVADPRALYQSALQTLEQAIDEFPTAGAGLGFVEYAASRLRARVTTGVPEWINAYDKQTRHDRPEVDSPEGYFKQSPTPFPPGGGSTGPPIVVTEFTLTGRVVPEGDAASDEVIDEIELMGVLMDREWLGLRLLYALRGRGSAATASELAVEASVAVDACASTLARLLQYGALTLEGDRFRCSERGLFVLRRAEEIVREKKEETAVGSGTA